MPRYYCDYCDTYLTHDSPSVRKQHNAGYKHKANVRNYYQQYEAQLNQSLIDQKVKEHLGAYRPVGAPYASLRPGLPVLPTPPMSIPGGAQLPAGTPFVPGLRPPILPRPMPGAPGYMSAPPMPQMVAPPGAPLPGQANSFQRPMSGPTMVPGSVGMPTSSGAPPVGMPPSSGAPPAGMPPSSGVPPMFTPLMYPGNAPVPASGGTDSSSLNAPVSEANR